MIADPLSTVWRARAAVTRSFREQKRFIQAAFSLIVAMHNGKPDPVEAARLRKLLDERLASQRPTRGVLQKLLQKARGVSD
ncbi:hypothetical protein [Sphingomonas dokdonensis]|uniref:Uncharacterized protein n=1 Tax=Sphingomonas dokdonensis TaxID=344880 RepID=A0A245ZL10_9SPHN|nr:hypothetical protein [Sphingomonas dokdonensis]OWK30415.1 hypothetical protein SPDO_21010 [Sphingomonas dokdonensis]